MGKKRLVIIGGGFAGLNIAGNIDKNLFDVIIIDRYNYHSFPPLFYQIASSGLEPASISFPFRREMTRRRFRNCAFHMGEVRTIDTQNRFVRTQFETVPYDILVIAAGTTNNFFNIADIEKHVYTLKSTPEAIRCRNEILDRLERAELCSDAERRRRLLTFLVVGAGPTGVEIAGALGEMKRFVLKREYSGIRPDEMRVILVEGTDRVLRSMSAKSSDNALKALGQLMVDVRLGKTLKSYSKGTVTFSDGETIDTDTVIWTAGIRGVDFEFAGSGIKPAPGNRLKVDAFNAVEGLEDVYAIGDICMFSCPEYPAGHPQVAQVAIQQSRRLAANLNNPQKRKPFEYHNKGSMATIGRNRAVVDIGQVHFHGRIAWLAWMFVHLISLLGMRNRTVVLVNWIWNYFTFSSGLRLMLRPNRYPLRPYWDE